MSSKRGTVRLFSAHSRHTCTCSHARHTTKTSSQTLMNHLPQCSQPVNPQEPQKYQTVRMCFDHTIQSSNKEECNSTETPQAAISTCEVRTASSNYTHGYRSTNQPLKTIWATRHCKAMLSIPAARALSTTNTSTQLTACHPTSTIRSDCVLINRHIAVMKRKVTVPRHDTTH